tara:strand:+ start:1619 stop:2263 length:645 start_codon:yes stop_codon:yes gene_type:complete
MILKPITEFENYKISENGRIFNKRGRELKQTLNAQGYYQINLMKNKKSVSRRIHRLICRTFLPNFYGKRCVDHKNRTKTDNRIINLRWATHLENNENRSNPNTNTSGHTNISYYKSSKLWRFQKTINKKMYTKYFKTLEETIEYRDNKFMIDIKSGNKQIKLHSANTSGHKNISYHKQVKLWQFKKVINKKLYYKCFKTIKDAIDYKENKLYLL